MTTRRKTRTSADMRKVKKVIEKIPEDRQALATVLFKELVFVHNTMTDLKNQVEDEGAVDMFQQGKQKFLREHPALKAYNTTVQRFSLLYKQLMELLPPAEEVKKEVDELLDFVEGD